MKKFFVVGNSRSGTSMIALILGRHPDVFSFHELHFFEELWDPNGNHQSLSHKESIRLMARLISIQRDGYFRQEERQLYFRESENILSNYPSPLTPPAIFEAFLAHETQRHQKCIACEQTPRNVFYIGEILSLFPEAFVINMIRDPRDILLSQKNKWKRRYLGMSDIPLKEAIRAWSNYHPITISMLWNSSINAASGFLEHPQVFNMRFEDLVRSPENWVSQLSDFIGIDYVSQMLLVPKTGSSHKMDEPTAQGIDSSIAESWQKKQQHSNDLYIGQQITKKNMRLYGYTPVPLKKNWLTIFWIILLWPIKSILAFILNAGRTKNLFSTLRKRFLQ